MAIEAFLKYIYFLLKMMVMIWPEEAAYAVYLHDKVHISQAHIK